MDRKGLTRRALLLLLVSCLALCLSACRIRTGVFAQGGASVPDSGAANEAEQRTVSSEAADVSPEDGDAGNEEADGRTKENPAASRKEYDENAAAEVVPGTERLLHGEGEGNGAPHPADDAEEEIVNRLDAGAEETATQTVPAGEAEKMGVSEDAEQAESAMTYYTVLLKDRGDSLFECQRATVYWETEEDHVTIHKSSMEHTMILTAGAYDVSARLLEENLRVDDGWVARKNPQVIVKIVDEEVLGSGVGSLSAAKAVYEGLLAREGWQSIDAVRNRRVLLLSRALLDAPYRQTAALLMIAKTANPDLYADVDLQKALAMLTEEAAGTLPTGIYYYTGKEREP